MIELRSHVKSGTQVYTGAVFSERSAERYNAIQDRINACISIGVPVPPELEMESFKIMQEVALYS